MGPARHLALLPNLACETVVWPVPFADGLPVLVGLRGRKVVALASGDPFWFGAGSVIARALEPGDVFVALPGAEHDGRDFIEPALAAGAVAVLTESGRELNRDDERVISVSGLKGELGALANRLYGSPSGDLKVVAATGTNGKTSVVDLTAQMLRRTGRKTGTIGTLGMRLDQQPTETRNTTPDCLALHRQLRQWRDQGRAQERPRIGR